jgi:DNA-binding CsgD family transcriptional regulator
MLVGRTSETAAVTRLLAGAREGQSGVLVLRGEAGIGKSALLEDALESATGFTVLRGAGIESESELAYAALHQILRPVFDRIERLPDPQAIALRAAFALSAETVEERFRVSLGVLGLLAEVAEEGPLLCLVDDAQWIDRASADALVFTARRLTVERIVLLFAARDDENRSFAAPGLPELRPPALTPRESRSLLTQQLGSDVGSAAVDWLIMNANGNPLALLELPNSLSRGQLAGQESMASQLPPATSVEKLYLQRVDALPQSVRTLLVLAATEDLGARATIERAAAELGLEIAELAAAETAGLLTVDSERISFRHPLVRSAVYRGATFTERELAHRTLATASAAEGNADRAAWHRAAATVGTDEELARELASTAERARLRGGYAAASAALERAAELSADTEAGIRRLVAAATAAWHGGQTERAKILLDRTSQLVTDPRLRADVEHIRGEIELRCGALPDAGEILFSGAERVTPFDPNKAFEMFIDAGSVAGRSGDIVRMSEVGLRVAELPRSEDEARSLLTDLVLGLAKIVEGESAVEVRELVEAIVSAGTFYDPRLLTWAATGASVVGDQALETALLRGAVDAARASGAIDTLVLVLEVVVSSRLVAGRYDIESEATEGLRLAREAGLPNAAAIDVAALAWIAALKGRGDECRAFAAEATQVARQHGLGNANSIAEWAVALFDLSIGRPEETVSRLTALRDSPPGVAHPIFTLMAVPDLVEAGVRAGREEEAREAFGALDAFAQPGAPGWALALAARCRALLAQNGDAVAEFDDAMGLDADCNRPFDAARTKLLYGEFLRRQRRRTDSREHLRAAVDGFEDLGAVAWAERARTELRASGETARKRDPSTIDQLTPQELQIAQLVGEGHSNKDVAARLFLSPRTVEYHLRKVFAKLGISSRAELIRHGVAAWLDPALVS